MLGIQIVEFFQKHPDCLYKDVECITPPNVINHLSIEDVLLIDGCAVFQTEGNYNDYV
jgi:hypothetical protein